MQNNNLNKPLRGKTAIVTGASAGIGWLLTLPQHVNEIMIRPTGQGYP